MDEKKVTLFRSPAGASTSRTEEARIDDEGRLVVAGADLGETPRETFGDADHEFWVTVPEEMKDRVLLALLRSRFGGESGAVTAFRDWLEEREIPHGFETWS